MTGKGKLALVTGGSRGIGKSIAENLARRGFDLLLVSCDEEELISASYEIKTSYGTKVCYRVQDLALENAGHLLFDYCQGERFVINLLVNNAGVFIYNDVLNCEVERLEKIIQLHVMTTTVLCRLFGEEMAKRKSGWILNVASYSKWMCYPGLATYSASKNYVESFTRAFAGEMREHNVKVMAVSPAGVTTDLYGLSAPYKKLGLNLGILWTPNLIARTTLQALFFGRPSALVLSIHSYVPGLLNLVFLPVVAFLPRTFVWIARHYTKRFQK